MKILIIRFSSIGDVVLTTPLVRALKEQVPGCTLHYVIRKAFLPVISANPYIDRIFTIEEKIGEVLPALRREHYDHIVDLHKNFRSFGIRLALMRRSSSFPKLNFRKWLLVNLKLDRLPALHVVDRYFEALRPFGVTNDGKGLDYFIPGEEQVDPDTLPDTFRNGYTAFVIGAKHATKALPEEKIIAVCRMLESPVILIGGKEDEERGRRISAASGDHVLNACGAYSINQSADLIRQSRSVITHDTGMMHIASAFRKKIVSIWGNTVPEFGMFPYMPGNQDRSAMIEVKGLPCRPCSKIGYDRCPRGHFKCMQDIDEKEIVRRI